MTQGLPAHHNMFGGNLVPSCLDLFDIWQSQQFFVCSVLSGWSTVNCGVGRKLPAPQHPATSAPTPPSQPSIRDLSHNPILPCFISSSPIVVFPQSPLLYLFRWLLCSSATVFVFFQPLPYFLSIWAQCLFFHAVQWFSNESINSDACCRGGPEIWIEGSSIYFR